MMSILFLLMIPLCLIGVLHSGSFFPSPNGTRAHDPLRSEAGLLLGSAAVALFHFLLHLLYLQLQIFCSVLFYVFYCFAELLILFLYCFLDFIKLFICMLLPLLSCFRTLTFDPLLGSSQLSVSLGSVAEDLLCFLDFS